MHVEFSKSDNTVAIVLPAFTAAQLASVLGGVVDRTHNQGLDNLYNSMISAGVGDFNTADKRWLSVEDNEDFDPDYPGDVKQFIVAE